MLYFVSVADIPPSIRALYVGKDGRRQIKISPIDDVWDFDKLRQFVADLRRVDPNVSGVPVGVMESAQLMHSTFLSAAGLTIALVSLLLILLMLAWHCGPPIDTCQAADSLEFAIIQPGQPGTAQDAQPATNKLAAYPQARLTSKTSITGCYFNAAEEALNFLRTHRPAWGIDSLRCTSAEINSTNSTGRKYG